MESLSPAELHRIVGAFLQQERVMSLATVDDQGLPHAANLWYASDDQNRLFFVSHPQSAHSRHVVARPQVAATIYAPVARAEENHGVQIHGSCALVTGLTEQAAALALFLRRYPELALKPAVVARMHSESFYRVDPHWWRWIDNRRGFGFKAEGGRHP